MISNPVQNSYYLALPKEFIYDSIRQKMGDIYKYGHLPFHDIIDYINYTMVSANIPGITDQGTGIGTGSKG